uniref:Uncharacterized protein n=1 Tax=Opuntia streptacantha TaxID=393608 RepID=A0A7C9DXN2_OPUST
MLPSTFSIFNSVRGTLGLPEATTTACRIMGSRLNLQNPSSLQRALKPESIWTSDERRISFWVSSTGMILTGSPLQTSHGYWMAYRGQEGRVGGRGDLPNPPVNPMGPG